MTTLIGSQAGGSSKEGWLSYGRQGNSFDQAALMVQLLRQAGYTSNYVLGTLQLTIAQASAWFKTQSTLTAVEDYVSAYAIPWSWVEISGVYYLRMSHVWVQCVISGTTYVFDPTYKNYNLITASLTNIASKIGYTQSALLADAENGATIDPNGNYVQNWNRGKIATDLTDVCEEFAKLDQNKRSDGYYRQSSRRLDHCSGNDSAVTDFLAL